MLSRRAGFSATAGLSCFIVCTVLLLEFLEFELNLGVKTRRN